MADVGEADAFGHRHKMNVGEVLASELKTLTGIEAVASDLTYDLRSGEPDMLDSMVATTFANVAMDLIRDGIGGRMVAIRDGKYAHVSLAETGKPPRRVQLDAYDTDRLPAEVRGPRGRPAAAHAVARARRRLTRPAPTPRGRPSPPGPTATGSRARGSTCPRRRSRGRRGPASSWAASDGDRQRGAGRPGELERDRQVLEVERGPEPERVVVGDHLPAPVLEDPALGHAAAERRRDGLRVEARLHREDHPLGDAEVDAGDHDLVHGLDGLARARRAEVGDGRAHRGQDRPGALDVVGLAADEDREGRLAGAFRAARDRRVDHADAALAEPARRTRRSPPARSSSSR